MKIGKGIFWCGAAAVPVSKVIQPMPAIQDLAPAGRICGTFLPVG
jgi:hypothetical protein